MISQPKFEVPRSVADIIEEDSDKYPFEVFLCGPSIESETSGAKLRELIKAELEKKKFTVVLGEDDGVQELHKRFGLNAQSREIGYVDKTKHCRAVVIVADSVGAYCELGLFNWLFINGGKDTFSQEQIEFVVILDKKYEGKESYLNHGPLKNLKKRADIIHVNFKSYNAKTFVETFVKEFVNRRADLLVNDPQRD